MGNNERGADESVRSTCANCGNDVDGNYCANCGQRVLHTNPGLKALVREFLQSVALLDIRLYNTLLLLVQHPGRFLRNYIGGKQTGFIGPVHFFILSLGVYLFLFVTFGDSLFEYISDSFLSGEEAKDKLEIRKLGAYLKVNLNYLYFILPPVLAFYIRPLVRGLKYNFTQCLMIAFYLTGLAIFYNGIVLILSLVDSRLFALRLLIIFVPLPLALSYFDDKRSLSGYFRSLMAVMIGYLTYATIVGAITAIRI